MMVRQASCRRTVLVTATLWLCATNLQAAPPTLSQQLLRSYFDTASACTTSQISDIRDSGDIVTIEIVIEADIRAGLVSMQKPDRDDWFSLHCPPEIHGVWRQPQPPHDILVTGLLGDGENYTLSCVAFQSGQRNARELTLRYRIQRWLEQLLEN